MNEYQLKSLKKYEESARRLRPIVDELNAIEMEEVTEWEMVPMDEGLDYVPRYIYIRALCEKGPLKILCARDEYQAADRWEFSPCEWPKYKDSDGSTKTISPHDLWNPKEVAPKTTAQQDREPKAIARQIANKIIPEYLRIYARATERAQDAQGYSDSTRDALSRLAAACRDRDSDTHGRPRRSFFVRELEGSTVSVEFRSLGSCKIELSTDEMIEVVGLLRKLRNPEAVEYIDILSYKCHDQNCGHEWSESFDEQYGEHDDDCPNCGSRHNSPRRVAAEVAA